MNKKWYLVALIIFLVAYSILRFGEFETGVQQQTFPALYRLQNAGYLENDWYTNLISSEFNVRTLDLKITLLINSLFKDLELTLFLVYIVAYSLIFVNVFYLSYYFFEDSKKSFFISCLSFIGITFSLDGTDLTKLIVTPATIAWLFGIFSVNFYFRKRYTISFLMLGIATLFQIVIGNIVFFVLVSNVLLAKPFSIKEKIKNILKIWPFMVILLVSAIPLIVENQEATSQDITTEAGLIYSRFAHPGHVHPLSWGIMTYFIFSVFISLFLFSLYQSACEPEIKNKIILVVGSVFGLFIIGFFFTEYLILSIIIKLDLFRAGILLNIFGYIFIGDYIYRKIVESKRTLENVFWSFMPFSFLSPVLLLIGSPIIFSTAFIEHAKGKEFLSKFFKDKVFWFFVAVIFLIVIVIIYTNGIFENFATFLPKTSHSTIAYIIAPLLFYILARIFLTEKYPKFVVSIIVALTILTLIYYPPLQREYTLDQETKEVFTFLHRETPAESIILTPPYEVGFRLGADRAIVVDRLHDHTDKGIIEWFDRIKAVSNNHIKDPLTEPLSENVDAYYQTLQEENILQIKDKYGISYAVFKKDKQLNFFVAFENEKYIVYRIP